MMMGFGFPFMWLFWILIIGLIIWAVVQIANRSAGNQSAGGHYPQITSQQDNALEVLKKRYARGEITKEEYDAIRQDIAQ